MNQLASRRSIVLASALAIGLLTVLDRHRVGDTDRAAARVDPHLAGNSGTGRHLHHPHRRTRTRTPTAPRSSTSKATSCGSTPIPQGRTAADFRTQTYRGQPVLTWWQGTGLGGSSSGTDYIYNDQYQQIATVKAGNGLSADGHEFLITP